MNNAAEEFQRTFSNPAAKLPDDEIEDLVKRATDHFETNAKKAFNGVISKASIEIGPSRYTIAAVGVKRGRMSLDR